MLSFSVQIVAETCFVHFLYFMREVKARESPHKCLSVCDSVCSVHLLHPHSRSGIANLISGRVLI